MSETREYKPGDVVNGYVLTTENEWVPDVPAKKKRTGLKVTLGIVGVLLAVGVVAAAAASGDAAKTPGAQAASSTPSTAAPEPSDSPSPSVGPQYATPQVGSFLLTVKTTSKHCFGSAGCNVEYQIKAGWTATFDPDKTYEVTYEVRGGEDGPVIDTMEVTGDEYRASDGFVSTATKGAKLTAVVTDVSEA
jgi:hypothetical protein